MSEAATISKREQKRQARLAKERAQKSSSEDVSDLKKGDISPTAGDNPADQVDAQFELKKSPYIEPVQKRYDRDWRDWYD